MGGAGDDEEFVLELIEPINQVNHPSPTDLITRRMIPLVQSLGQYRAAHQ